MSSRTFDSSSEPARRPSGTDRPGSFGRLLFGFAWTGALVFCLLGITRSVWLDEAFSINLASLTPSSIIEGLKLDGHPPFYFFLLAGWMRIFGDGEIAVRSLSGLLYLASAAGIYALARTVLDGSVSSTFSNGPRAARIATVLYLTSKIAVAHAQNARMYSLLGCLVVFTTLFYVRSFIIPRPTARDRGLYMLCVLLGTFTHFWYGFILLAQLIGWWLFGERQRWRSYLLCTTVACAPFVLWWMPILFKHQIYNGVSDWMQRQSFGIGTFFATLADYYGEGWLGGLFWLAVASMLFIGFEDGRPIVRGRLRLAQVVAFLRQRRILLFVTLPILSLTTPLLISQVRPIYRVGSYTIIALAPTVILIAALLQRFADRRLTNVFLVCLMCGALAVFSWLRTRPVTCSDRVAARQVLEQARPDDRILFTSLSRLAVEYYFRHSETGRALTLSSFPREIDEHPGWRSPIDQEKRRRSLDAEAARLDEDLRTKVDPGERLWLFYGTDTRISSLLKTRLDRWLEPVDEIACVSGFYSTILLYERPPPAVANPPL